MTTDSAENDGIPPPRGAGIGPCVSVGVDLCARLDKKSLQGNRSNRRRGLSSVRCPRPSALHIAYESQKLPWSQLSGLEWRAHDPGVVVVPNRLCSVQQSRSCSFGEKTDELYS